MINLIDHQDCSTQNKFSGADARERDHEKKYGCTVEPSAATGFVWLYRDSNLLLSNFFLLIWTKPALILRKLVPLATFGYAVDWLQKN